MFTKRVIVVVIAYLLSSYGMLVMLKIAAEELVKPDSSTGGLITAILWMIAWALHAVMSVAWIRGVRLGTALATSGAAFGIGGLLLFPLYGALYLAPMRQAFNQTSYAAEMQVFLVQLVTILPCVLLAFWLVIFHWKR